MTYFGIFVLPNMLVIDCETLERMFVDGLVKTIPDVLTLFEDMQHYARRNDHNRFFKMIEDNHGHWWGITMAFTLPYWYYPERMPPSSLWLWERIEDDASKMLMLWESIEDDEVNLNAMD